jgi:NTP pyrophosphatase (non-canonical NTP hydrolase)
VLDEIIFIEDHSKDELGLMLNKLSRVSKISGVSHQYCALNKVEEELTECLMEVRRLKNHYDEIKIARKHLNLDTHKKTVKNLIEEMGDVYNDLFLYLPSVIDIDNDALNKRIRKKLEIYENVLKETTYKIN